MLMVFTDGEYDCGGEAGPWPEEIWRLWRLEDADTRLFVDEDRTEAWRVQIGSSKFYCLEWGELLF